MSNVTLIVTTEKFSNEKEVIRKFIMTEEVQDIDDALEFIIDELAIGDENRCYISPSNFAYSKDKDTWTYADKEENYGISIELILFDRPFEIC